MLNKDDIFIYIDEKYIAGEKEALDYSHQSNNGVWPPIPQ